MPTKTTEMAARKTPAEKLPVKRAAKPAVAKRKSTASGSMKKSADSRDFAIILTGGKQYGVCKGKSIKIEKLTGAKSGNKEVKVGDKVIFDKVLLVDNGKETKIGTPYVPGAKVEAVLAEEGKSKKINVIRFKSKSRYFKRRGHRQPYNIAEIKDIK